MAEVVERLMVRPEVVAELLDIPRTRVYELMGKGQLRSVKIGRLRRVPMDEVRRFVAEAQESALTA